MYKILIISDTHFASKVDERLALLKNLIPQYDQVIINGDFWDCYLTTWNRFVKSGWSELFPLLKSKNTIYIYGNHDHPNRMDEKVSLFSNHQMWSLEIESEGYNIHIEHGNGIIPSLEEVFPFITKSRKLIKLEYRIFDGLVRKHLLPFIKYGRRMNNKMLKKFRGKDGKSILVTGHSHFPESRNEQMFYNSGLIRWNRLDYIEILDGKINLVKSSY